MFKKLSALSTALAVALVPVLSYAEGTTGTTSSNIEIPSQFTEVDFSDFISDLASQVATPVIGVIGLMAGIWVLQLIWRKVRSTGR